MRRTGIGTIKAATDATGVAADAAGASAAEAHHAGAAAGAADGAIDAYACTVTDTVNSRAIGYTADAIDATTSARPALS
jgi:hypothetical protein